MKKILLLFIFVLQGYFGFSQSWQPLGPSDSDQPFYADFAYLTTAIDRSGTLYASYSDIDTNYNIVYRASVMKFNGTSWVRVGLRGFSNASTRYNSIAISSTGIPYVVYSDNGDSGKATVMKYNGTAWETVGNKGFSASMANFTTIAIDPIGTPYIAYEDSGNNKKVTVMKFNGTDWITVGSAGFSLGATKYTSIAIDNNGTPYVAFENVADSDKVTVMKYEGSNWAILGKMGISVGGVEYPSMAIDGNNIPYIIYQDDYLQQVVVMKYDTTSWGMIGKPLTSPEFPSSHPHIAVDGNGTLYASIENGNDNGVFKYNGNSWVNVGSYNDVIGGDPMVVDYTGTIYNGTAKYNGSEWVTIGSTGISNASAGQPSLTINNEGALYTVFIDYNYNSALSVMKYNGSSWVEVGKPGFTNEYAKNPAIAIDKSGTPYVAYVDGSFYNGYSFRANVMKYIDSSWVQVGAFGFSPGSTSNTSIAIDSSGTPYVAFDDDDYYGSATVMKFNDTSWVNVGIPDFIGQNEAQNINIAFDHAGAPYIVYVNANEFNKNRGGVVMKFVSGNWISVGGSYFPSINIGSPSLAFDKSDVPYLAYADGANSDAVSVIKYNGTSWVSVGKSGFSPGVAESISIAVDKNNVAYVAYQDAGEYGISPGIPNKATVMKFDGSSWGPLGEPDFTAGDAAGISLAIDSNDILYVEFASDGYLWAYNYTSKQPACVPSVYISTSPSYITCPGRNITFTAMPINGGVSPSFQWFIDSLPVGNNSATYDAVLSQAGNTSVYCTMTSSDACASPVLVSSNVTTVTILSPVTPSVTISASPSTSLCQSRVATFTATPVNGGGKPTYQWVADGANVGIDSAIYQNATFSLGTHTLYCIMTSNDSCASPKTVNSDTLTLSVSGNNIVNVRIGAVPSGPICNGTNVVFTAVPSNDGSVPIYQWKINGINAGANGTVFSTSTLNNGDTVTCTLTSDMMCTLNNPATSVPIIMTVGSSLMPSVSLTANPGDTVCLGVRVAFAAKVSNQGSNPVYEWFLNQVQVPDSGIQFNSDSLHDGDIVSVKMNSSEHCLTIPSVADSIQMTVAKMLSSTPLAISASALNSSWANANWNAVPNASIYFLDVAKDSLFTKLIAGYNNLNVGNVLSYPVNGLSAITMYYYRVRAANSCNITPNSNIINFTTTACQPLVAGVVGPTSTLICSDSTTTLTETGASGGTLQWQISSNNITWANVPNGGTDSIYTTLASNGISTKYYRCLAINGCYTSSGNTAIVGINAKPVMTVTNTTATTVTIAWVPSATGCDNLSWSGAAGSGNANALSNNSYTITSLTPGSMLSITLTPCLTCPGVSSSSITALTLCANTCNPTVTALAAPTHGFTVSWCAVLGATGYRVYYRDLAGNPNWSFVDVTTSSTTIITPYGGHTYAVYVVAKNCPSVGSFGQPSTVQYVTTNPPSACNPVPTVTAISNCPNQLTINITGGSGPYHLTLQRISPGISASATYKVSSTIVNITLGSQYAGSVWEVFATTTCGAAGVSNPSNIAIVEVKPGCPVVDNLVISQVACQGFTASWNTTDCSGLGITGYNLLVKKKSTSNYTAYPVGLSNHISVSSLTPSTTYNVLVMAVACNGATSGSSVPDTVSLPICREEVPIINDTTDVQVGDKKETVTLYPNPSPGVFNLEVTTINSTEATVKIELLNQLGQILQTDISSMKSGHLIQQITTPIAVSSGIYFVRTSTGSNVYVNRVMISRE